MTVIKKTYDCKRDLVVAQKRRRFSARETSYHSQKDLCLQKSPCCSAKKDLVAAHKRPHQSQKALSLYDYKRDLVAAQKRPHIRNRDRKTNTSAASAYSKKRFAGVCKRVCVCVCVCAFVRAHARVCVFAWQGGNDERNHRTSNDEEIKAVPGAVEKGPKPMPKKIDGELKGEDGGEDPLGQLHVILGVATRRREQLRVDYGNAIRGENDHCHTVLHQV